MFDKLIKWSLLEYSYLPWRKRRTVYRTLVSEIMLQQTTVSTVINKFENFMLQFASISSVASATEEELTIAWKGLGYYRRCKNLKMACEYFCDYHGGKIPSKFDELLKAPGIGKYTANAILAIGKNKKAIAVDANLERVISRLYNIAVTKGPGLIKEIYARFNSGKILKNFSGSYRDLNEALMDLGRVFCISKNPRCEICPMNRKCLALKEGQQSKLPIMKTMDKKSYLEVDLLRVLIRRKNHVLVYTKTEREWLRGQVELPTFTLNKPINQYPEWGKSINLKNLESYKTNITKYKFTNYIMEMTKTDFDKICENSKYFFNEIDFENQNFSTASIKALKKREGL